MNEIGCVVFGVDMTVEFEWESGGGDGWHEPCYPDNVVVHSVKYHELDFIEYNVLDQKTLDDIEQSIIDSRNDEIDPYMDYNA
jgi:hypothetical protein